MTANGLEQILEHEPMAKPDTACSTVDLYARGTAALYTPPLRIYNMPDTNFSIHIHGSPDGNFLYGGSIQELGTNRVLRELNGYECSMFDYLYGTELGLPNKIGPSGW